MFGYREKGKCGGENTRVSLGTVDDTREYLDQEGKSAENWILKKGTPPVTESKS